jgi:hypothetical protein
VLSPEKLEEYRRMTPEERWRDFVHLMDAAWASLDSLPVAERNRRLDLLQRQLHEILEKSQTPYMFMGGITVGLWGIPRPTFDLDLTLEVDDSTLSEFLRQLEQAGFTVPQEFKKGYTDVIARMRKIKVQTFAGERAWDIDVFLVTTEYQKAAFARRRRMVLMGRAAWVIAPEDLVLHKLVAGRPRDIGDIDDVLMVTAPLELEYLRRWGGTLGVLDVLEERLRLAYGR